MLIRSIERTSDSESAITVLTFDAAAVAARVRLGASRFRPGVFIISYIRLYKIESQQNSMKYASIPLGRPSKSILKICIKKIESFVFDLVVHELTTGIFGQLETKGIAPGDHADFSWV